MESAKLKLARQALASHKAKLATAANKDEVRRAIRATEARIKELEQERDPAVGDTVRITRPGAKGSVGNIVNITKNSQYPYKVMSGGYLHHLAITDFEPTEES